MRNIDRMDPTFVADLVGSLPAVKLVAAWYADHNYLIDVPRVHIRPRAELASQYSDAGDLYVEAGRGRERKRIEVKRRRFCFTSRRDYPYPTVMVCNCHNFDKASPRPYSIWILSADLVAAAEFFACFSAQWSAGSFRDRGRTRRAYYAPKFCGTWRRIPPALRASFT